ncbi:MAG: hypothetical protein ABSG81_07850 [Acidimicrobiales bacterium]
MRGARLESVGERSVERFVREALFGLATLDAEDRTPDNLSLPLGLSLWMRRGGVGVMGARAALLALRGALLEASGIDARREPVPLVVADPSTAAISLALYLDGLLERAAATRGVSREDMAERAVALLVA